MLNRSLRLYTPHPLWNALPNTKLASVPIQEMWQLGRDMIIYPPVQIIPGVVDQRWIGTSEAGQGVWHGQPVNMFLAILHVCWHCLGGRDFFSNILLDWHDMCVKAFIHIALDCK